MCGNSSVFHKNIKHLAVMPTLSLTFHIKIPNSKYSHNHNTNSYEYKSCSTQQISINSSQCKIFMKKIIFKNYSEEI